MRTAATHEGSTTARTGKRSSRRTSVSGSPTAATQARSVLSSSRAPAIQARIGCSQGRIRWSPQPSAAAVSAVAKASTQRKSASDAS